MNDEACWCAVKRMFSAEIAIKPEENAVFENAQIEVPVGKGLGIASLRRCINVLRTSREHCFTRQATQGRGGSRGLRSFRRGRWGDRT